MSQHPAINDAQSIVSGQFCMAGRETRASFGGAGLDPLGHHQRSKAIHPSHVSRECCSECIILLLFSTEHTSLHIPSYGAFAMWLARDQ